MSIDSDQLDEFYEGKTLNEMRVFVREHRKYGVTCPCCSQTVKVYERAMNYSMASYLKALLVLSDGRIYVHIAEIEELARKSMAKTTGGRDFACLKGWNLIEQLPKDPNDKKRKTSGMWKITQKGIDFVNGKISLQAKVVMLNRQYLGVTGDEIYFGNAMANTFDLEEVMQPAEDVSA